MAIFSNALSTLREQGLRVFAEKAAATVGLRRMLLLEADLALSPPPPRAKVALAFGMLCAADVELFLVSQPEIDGPTAVRKLSQGCVCALALHQGHVAASAWVARDTVSSGWAHIRRNLAADEAYNFACHTAVAFRGKGIGPALHGYLANSLRQQGVRRVYRLVLPWNAPSLRSSSKAGFSPCGQYLSLGFGRLETSRFLASGTGSGTRR